MAKSKPTFSLPVTLAAEKIVSGQSKICAKRLKKYKSEDPESLHDLRVELRRLRSYLRIFRLYLPESCKKERKALEQLFQLSNKNRELDVHKAVLTSWLQEESLNDDQRAAIESVLGYTQTKPASQLPPNFDKGVRAVLDDLNGKLKPSKNDAKAIYCHEFAVKVIENYGKRLEFFLNGMAESNDALHKARITAKRLRYFIEVLELEAVEEAVAELKGWQSELGDIHDLMVLEDFLYSVLLRLNEGWLETSWKGETPPTTLPESIKQLFALKDFVSQKQQAKREGLSQEKRAELLAKLEASRLSLKALSQA